MKKLVLVSSFIVLGVMAYAQTPTKSNATVSTKEVKATAVVAPVVEQMAITDAVAPVTEEKKAEKKDCSAEAKKACGTKAEGKKSCCSSKAEAKKEENK